MIRSLSFNRLRHTGARESLRGSARQDDLLVEEVHRQTQLVDAEGMHAAF